MESVTLSRGIEAPESVVRELVTDVKPFMEAAEFDEVRVDGDVVEIANSVGLLTIDLTLRRLDTDAAFAYEQVDGIFDRMVTRYTIDETETGVVITATTEYELDIDVVGSILDTTIIARQRRKELSAQFDYLQAEAESRS